MIYAVMCKGDSEHKHWFNRGFSTKAKAADFIDRCKAAEKEYGYPRAWSYNIKTFGSWDEITYF